MNQIKYLMYAFLMLCCLAVTIYVFVTVSSAEISKPTNPVVIDNATSNTESVNMISAKGKLLFQQNCESCHSTDKLDAYALYGFTKINPWTEKENIYKWINNPTAFMKHDPRTKALKDEFGVIMPAFPDLKREEIDEIVSYINATPARSKMFYR